MIGLTARNVNYALYGGTQILNKVGVKRDSRNGPVILAPDPVSTLYTHPMERVMLHPNRDANPFFHLVEALWMIAGREDLATLTPFVQRMAEFSDDGGMTQPGAYGHRWRNHFGREVYEETGIGMTSSWIQQDQLEWAIKRLKADPNDRRVVIQMYDADVDQYAADNGGRDIPCNLSALPTVGTDGRLDLTVYNRSNDMIWGAYGANAVHFSVLQECIAASIGVPVGKYHQVSNNFHAYEATMDKASDIWPWGLEKTFQWKYRTEPGLFETGNLRMDPYAGGEVFYTPIFQNGFSLKEMTEDINMFIEDPARVGIRSKFLRSVACPMVMAHRAHKMSQPDVALEILKQMSEMSDWRAGAEIWLANRAEAAKQKEAQNENN